MFDCVAVSHDDDDDDDVEMDGCQKTLMKLVTK